MKSGTSLIKLGILLQHILLLLVFLPVFPQEKAVEDYTQKIPGSELTVEMVAIPDGQFLMGSSQDENARSADEGPVRLVEISGFWMSKHEITWELYDLYLQRSVDKVDAKEKGSEVQVEIDAVSGATIPYTDMSLGMGTGSGFPVVNITQLAASRFCKWLSAKTGHFYRLPTEAEWEYAARAGTTISYFFGESSEDLDDYAWYSENSGGNYHKVGEKKPNPWGLYDIYGNVAEWTLDKYTPEGYERWKNNRRDTVELSTEENIYSVRGGSFYDKPGSLRSAARMRSSKNWKTRDPQFPKSIWWNTDAAFVGFRIVRPFHPPAPEEQELYWGERN